ncbi:MAG: aminodeoxychorismate/anthranilate synthase component II [Bacteroidetes bacterium]|nr:aminodeoxychorismate/anthranilate synthase component II [Bacteroidota bacterium]
MRILLIDNHDSFTYNLADLLRRNSKVSFNIIKAESVGMEEPAKYDKILFSPGPGLPQEHQEMFTILKKYSGTKPILGICLGFQAIAIHFGGELYNLKSVVHGQPRQLIILNREHYLFRGIPDNTPVGLYHSWAVKEANLPDCLEILARSHDGTILAIRHKQFDICGVQFHPESIMTTEGKKIVNNWINHELS